MEEGDLSPENLKKIATELDVPEADVVSMNRRLASPDHSLNAPLRSDSEGEWQDWLVDESESQETRLGERQELGLRRDLLEKAMTHLNDRERHILTERRSRKPDHARGPVAAIRHLARARAADRGPRLRKAAEGDQSRRDRAPPRHPLTQLTAPEAPLPHPGEGL